MLRQGENLAVILKVGKKKKVNFFVNFAVSVQLLFSARVWDFLSYSEHMVASVTGVLVSRRTIFYTALQISLPNNLDSL